MKWKHFPVALCMGSDLLGISIYLTGLGKTRIHTCTAREREKGINSVIQLWVWELAGNPGPCWGNWWWWLWGGGLGYVHNLTGFNTQVVLYLKHKQWRKEKSPNTLWMSRESISDFNFKQGRIVWLRESKNSPEGSLACELWPQWL